MNPQPATPAEILALTAVLNLRVTLFVNFLVDHFPYPPSLTTTADHLDHILSAFEALNNAALPPMPNPEARSHEL